MVNLSMAYANLKQNDKAEAWLRRAVKAEPDNAAANFNLGLLLAEAERLDEAEKALRAALKSDPQLAPAAYNLAVILGQKKDLAGAVQWCRKAHDLRPDELEVHAQPGLLSERQRRQGRGRRRVAEGDPREPILSRRLRASWPTFTRVAASGRRRPGCCARPWSSRDFQGNSARRGRPAPWRWKSSRRRAPCLHGRCACYFALPKFLRNHSRKGPKLFSFSARCARVHPRG